MKKPYDEVPDVVSGKSEFVLTTLRQHLGNPPTVTITAPEIGECNGLTVPDAIPHATVHESAQMHPDDDHIFCDVPGCAKPATFIAGGAITCHLCTYHFISTRRN